jgi:predicted GIY-YIG superfamily endonuclease
MASNDTPHFIYVLIDPRDDTLLYVGRTCQPETRLHSHMRDPASGLAPRVGELRECGEELEMLKIDSVPNKTAARAAERYWLVALQYGLAAETLNVSTIGLPHPWEEEKIPELYSQVRLPNSAKVGSSSPLSSRLKRRMIRTNSP